MTRVSYEVTDLEGNVTIVNSKPEADLLIQKTGGSCRQVFKETLSTSEAYCKAYVRQHGKQSGR